MDFLTVFGHFFRLSHLSLGAFFVVKVFVVLATVLLELRSSGTFCWVSFFHFQGSLLLSRVQHCSNDLYFLFLFLQVSVCFCHRHRFNSSFWNFLACRALCLELNCVLQIGVASSLF